MSLPEVEEQDITSENTKVNNGGMTSAGAIDGENDGGTPHPDI